MGALGRFPLRAGVATLVARRALTPLMIRVTLAADAFRDAWPMQQPGEIVTLLFAGPGEPIASDAAAQTASRPQQARSPAARGPARRNVVDAVIVRVP